MLAWRSHLRRSRWPIAFEIVTFGFGLSYFPLGGNAPLKSIKRLIAGRPSKSELLRKSWSPPSKRSRNTCPRCFPSISDAPTFSENVPTFIRIVYHSWKLIFPGFNLWTGYGHILMRPTETTCQTSKILKLARGTSKNCFLTPVNSSILFSRTKRSLTSFKRSLKEPLAMDSRRILADIQETCP